MKKAGNSSNVKRAGKIESAVNGSKGVVGNGNAFLGDRLVSFFQIRSSSLMEIYYPKKKEEFINE